MKISRYLMKRCILKYLKKTQKTEIFHEIFHRQKKNMFFTSLVTRPVIFIFFSFFISLQSTHLFVSIAIETNTMGCWNESGMDFVREPDRKEND